MQTQEKPGLALERVSLASTTGSRFFNDPKGELLENNVRIGENTGIQYFTSLRNVFHPFIVKSTLICSIQHWT